VEKEEHRIHDFLCKQGAGNSGRGTPQFVSVNGSAYVFSWETTYACASPAHDCIVYYENQIFDISSLRNDSADYKIQSDSDGTFFINICGPLVDTSVCGDLDSVDPNACQINQNQHIVLASADSVSFDYNTTAQQITATYYGGFQGDIVVYLIQCSLNATSGPSYFGKFNNAHTFSWQNKAACAASKYFHGILGRK